MVVTGSRMQMIVRRQPVLAVSAVLCIICVMAVRPGADVLDSIDWEMLCTLFCFMSVVSALSECGAFGRMAESVISERMDSRRLCVILVLLPLICSMFITNDVALITFVPFAIMTLERIGRRDLILPVAVMQTLAANTGCMMTPFGSPHNLLVFSHYGLGIADVVSSMAPYFAAGTALILAMCLAVPRDRVIIGKDDVIEIDIRSTAVLALSFIVCVACVMGLVPWWMMLAVSVTAVCATAPRSLLKVNYGLLATFVFLFVLVGTATSVGRIDSALESLMGGDPFLPAVGISQIISNVPAATLLSSFTDDWNSLLAGVNVGGFGTPIASMASVITFGLYSKAEGADVGRFTLVFLATNALMVCLLTAVRMLP